jgi:hypothetical protein
LYYLPLQDGVTASAIADKLYDPNTRKKVKEVLQEESNGKLSSAKSS